MTVEVYRNLRKKCYSIRSTLTGRVVGHSNNIGVVNAKFVVRPAGREKVRREKRKNVHAFIKGQQCYAPRTMGPADTWKKVSYNPYKNDSFVIVETGEPIHEAKLVILNDAGCWVKE